MSLRYSSATLGDNYCLNTADQPQMTADHYRSSNPNLSPNPNPNPNHNLNRSSAVICGVQADRHTCETL